MKEKIPLVCIVGPTASGKTAVSIELAKRVKGEIVSADSMQIYRGMDIGTAKPDACEMQGIPHHMINIADITESFSVAQYCEKAKRHIKDITDRGNMPIIAGGTGLYIDAVVGNIIFSPIKADGGYREELLKLKEEKGSEYLHDRLKECDPNSAQRLHVNDTKRIVRALEVYRTTGITISEHNKRSTLEPSPYSPIFFALSLDRQVLYKRIDDRVDLMMKNGLFDEVVRLKESGAHMGMTAMQSLGYKELMEYLDGGCTLDEAIQTIKTETRRYAKRQLTWFRRNKSIIWIDVDSYGSASLIAEYCQVKIKEYFV